MPTAVKSHEAPGRVWREVEAALLILLVVGVYFTRLTSLTIRGEESRWTQVAYEMLASGNWVVPTQQFQPFPDRPPMGSWCIAVATLIFGKSLAAVRLPTVLATLLTTLVVYAYSRRFLNRASAFAAGAAYATMILILQLGRLAESDAVLALFVGSSLLAWHGGYMRGRRAALNWMLGYGLAGCAALTKGPQGPVYFIGATCVYLVWRRDWRYLFSLGHLAGVATLLAVVGAWQVPFAQAVGGKDVLAIWSEGSTAGHRFSDPARIGRHFCAYPLEILAAMFPWSILWIAFLSRRCRQSLTSERPYVAFVVIALAVAFPTCWLTADARPRHFMSLFPVAAVLVGVAFSACTRTMPITWWQKAWPRLLLGNALSIVVLAAVVVTATFGRVDRLKLLMQSPTFAVAFAMTALALAAVASWARRDVGRWQLRGGVLTLAATAGLVYAGLAVNVLAATNNQAAADVARLKSKLPPDAHLVSFDPIHHLFAYYYGEPIEQLSWRSLGSRASEIDYFCFSMIPGQKVSIPFAWEEVASISCDRNRKQDRRDWVVIGRRIAEPATARKKPFESSSR